MAAYYEGLLYIEFEKKSNVGVPIRVGFPIRMIEGASFDSYRKPFVRVWVGSEHSLRACVRACDSACISRTRRADLDNDENDEGSPRYARPP
jgi:hypothetical protein